MSGILYLVSIVFVNYMFAITGPEIGAVLVGGIFVLRDFVQKRYGHLVLVWMAAACLISYFIASPQVAIASATAFAVSELFDWAVYSVLPLPFHFRIFFSSFFGVFVDSVIFIPMALGAQDWHLVAIMWCSKMVVASAVFLFYVVKK